ncbi:MAG: 4-hydroxy-tetrahydrodipicolinate reductase, partial [Rectinemataceae bacterium]|nr:4-hydroxy-tetrahydrodipicolinate reductase [Rectinemataceae bacterium]
QEAARQQTIHIIGTTGLTVDQQQKIRDYAKQTVFVMSANFSIGVNVLLSLTEKVSRTLDTSYDIEIVEMHHRKKVDAPSGTALALGNAAAEGRKTELAKAGCFARKGHVGERKTGEIGFATLRGGDVVGDHTVIFATEGERIELTHKASSRVIFAQGAVRAALWAKGKPPGLYSMRDVLGMG